MDVALPQVEYHTSDVAKACPLAVKLRRDGKHDPKMTTALFRGSLFHEAARLIHETSRWDEPRWCVAEGLPVVLENAKAERRPITQSVNENMQAITDEVAGLMERYAARFASVFATAKLIGCELPVRMTIDVDGQSAEFASHVDLLWRDADKRLRLWDWKTGSDSPTWAYLSRNMQFGLYHCVCVGGSIRVGDHWIEFNEPPLMAWVHVNNLAPFGKRQSCKDDNGEVREFMKGDDRPLRNILRGVEINDEGAVLDDFRTWVRMDRAGLHPAIPSEQGCHLCESAYWCKSYAGGSDAE